MSAVSVTCHCITKQNNLIGGLRHRPCESGMRPWLSGRVRFRVTGEAGCRQDAGHGHSPRQACWGRRLHSQAGSLAAGKSVLSFLFFPPFAAESMGAAALGRENWAWPRGAGRSRGSENLEEQRRPAARPVPPSPNLPPCERQARGADTAPRDTGRPSAALSQEVTAPVTGTGGSTYLPA